jgi:hypothetical protein
MSKDPFDDLGDIFGAAPPPSSAPPSVDARGLRDIFGPAAVPARPAPAPRAAPRPAPAARPAPPAPRTAFADLGAIFGGTPAPQRPAPAPAARPPAPAAAPRPAPGARPRHAPAPSPPSSAVRSATFAGLGDVFEPLESPPTIPSPGIRRREPKGDEVAMLAAAEAQRARAASPEPAPAAHSAPRPAAAPPSSGFGGLGAIFGEPAAPPAPRTSGRALGGRTALPIVLIACSGTKNPEGRKLPAAERYAGDLFQKSLDYARGVTDENRIRILSAKYHVLRTMDEIPTYDLALDDFKVRDREAWGDRVRGILVSAFGRQPTEVVLLAGEVYADALRDLSRDEEGRVLPWTPRRPLKGLNIGEQKSWLLERTRPPLAPPPSLSRSLEVVRVARLFGRLVPIDVLHREGDVIVNRTVANDAEYGEFAVTHLGTSRVLRHFARFSSAIALAWYVNSEPKARALLDRCTKEMDPRDPRKESPAFKAMARQIGTLVNGFAPFEFEEKYALAHPGAALPSDLAPPSMRAPAVEVDAAPLSIQTIAPEGATMRERVLAALEVARTMDQVMRALGLQHDKTKEMTAEQREALDTFMRLVHAGTTEPGVQEIETVGVLRGLNKWRRIGAPKTAEDQFWDGKRWVKPKPGAIAALVELLGDEARARRVQRGFESIAVGDWPSQKFTIERLRGHFSEALRDGSASAADAYTTAQDLVDLLQWAWHDLKVARMLDGSQERVLIGTRAHGNLTLEHTGGVYTLAGGEGFAPVRGNAWTIAIVLACLHAPGAEARAEARARFEAAMSGAGAASIRAAQAPAAGSAAAPAARSPERIAIPIPGHKLVEVDVLHRAGNLVVHRDIDDSTRLALVHGPSRLKIYTPIRFSAFTEVPLAAAFADAVSASPEAMATMGQLLDVRAAVHTANDAARPALLREGGELTQRLQAQLDHLWQTLPDDKKYGPTSTSPAPSARVAAAEEPAVPQSEGGSVVRYVGAQYPHLAGLEGRVTATRGDAYTVRWRQRRGALRPADPRDPPTYQGHELKLLRGFTRAFGGAEEEEAAPAAASVRAPAPPVSAPRPPSAKPPSKAPNAYAGAGAVFAPAVPVLRARARVAPPSRSKYAAAAAVFAPPAEAATPAAAPRSSTYAAAAEVLAPPAPPGPPTARGQGPSTEDIDTAWGEGPEVEPAPPTVASARLQPIVPTVAWDDKQRPFTARLTPNHRIELLKARPEAGGLEGMLLHAWYQAMQALGDGENPAGSVELGKRLLREAERDILRGGLSPELRDRAQSEWLNLDAALNLAEERVSPAISAIKSYLARLDDHHWHIARSALSRGMTAVQPVGDRWGVVSTFGTGLPTFPTEQAAYDVVSAAVRDEERRRGRYGGGSVPAASVLATPPADGETQRVLPAFTSASVVKGIASGTKLTLLRNARGEVVDGGRLFVKPSAQGAVLRIDDPLNPHNGEESDLHLKGNVVKAREGGFIVTTPEGALLGEYIVGEAPAAEGETRYALPTFVGQAHRPRAPKPPKATAPKPAPKNTHVVEVARELGPETPEGGGEQEWVLALKVIVDKLPKPGYRPHATNRIARPWILDHTNAVKSERAYAFEPEARKAFQEEARALWQRGRKPPEPGPLPPDPSTLTSLPALQQIGPGTRLQIEDEALPAWDDGVRIVESVTPDVLSVRFASDNPRFRGEVKRRSLHGVDHVRPATFGGMPLPNGFKIVYAPLPAGGRMKEADSPASFRFLDAAAPVSLTPWRVEREKQRAVERERERTNVDIWATTSEPQATEDVEHAERTGTDRDKAVAHRYLEDVDAVKRAGSFRGVDPALLARLIERARHDDDDYLEIMLEAQEAGAHGVPSAQMGLLWPGTPAQVAASTAAAKEEAPEGPPSQRGATLVQEAVNAPSTRVATWDPTERPYTSTLTIPERTSIILKTGGPTTLDDYLVQGWVALAEVDRSIPENENERWKFARSCSIGANEKDADLEREADARDRAAGRVTDRIRSAGGREAKNLEREVDIVRALLQRELSTAARSSARDADADQPLTWLEAALHVLADRPLTSRLSEAERGAMLRETPPRSIEARLVQAWDWLRRAMEGEDRARFVDSVVVAVRAGMRQALDVPESERRSFAQAEIKKLRAAVKLAVTPDVAKVRVLDVLRIAGPATSRTAEQIAELGMISVGQAEDAAHDLAAIGEIERRESAGKAEAFALTRTSFRSAEEGRRPGQRIDLGDKVITTTLEPLRLPERPAVRVPPPRPAPTAEEAAAPSAGPVVRVPAPRRAEEAEGEAPLGIAVPFVTQGGTSREELKAELLDACAALEKAEIALRNARPHARDYQLFRAMPPDALQRAQRQHAAREAQVSRVRDELKAIRLTLAGAKLPDLGTPPAPLTPGEDLQLPGLNVIGSGQSHLEAQLRDAGIAVSEALNAVARCAPNARDYAPQGAFPCAVAQHEARLARLRAVYGQLAALFERFPGAGALPTAPSPVAPTAAPVRIPSPDAEPRLEKALDDLLVAAGAPQNRLGVGGELVALIGQHARVVDFWESRVRRATLASKILVALEDADVVPLTRLDKLTDDVMLLAPALLGATLPAAPAPLVELLGDARARRLLYGFETIAARGWPDDEDRVRERLEEAGAASLFDALKRQWGDIEAARTARTDLVALGDGTLVSSQGDRWILRRGDHEIASGSRHSVALAGAALDALKPPPAPVVRVPAPESAAEPAPRPFLYQKGLLAEDPIGRRVREVKPRPGGFGRLTGTVVDVLHHETPLAGTYLSVRDDDGDLWPYEPSPTLLWVIDGSEAALPPPGGRSVHMPSAPPAVRAPSPRPTEGRPERVRKAIRKAAHRANEPTYELDSDEIARRIQHGLIDTAVALGDLSTDEIARRHARGEITDDDLEPSSASPTDDEDEDEDEAPAEPSPAPAEPSIVEAIEPFEHRTAAKRRDANIRAMWLVYRREQYEHEHGELPPLTDDEKLTIAEYSDWGGIGTIEKFKDKFPPGFPVPEKRQLIHAYYTPPSVANEIARVVRPLLPGLAATDGNVHALEPAAGMGRLGPLAFSGMGFEIMKWHCVEQSALSYKMLHAIRPDVDLFHGFFEDWLAERGSDFARHVNLLVSNPPYGTRNYKATTDPRWREYDYADADTYFLRRGLDLLAHGGLGIYIVPSGFLTGNDKSGKARKLRAEVLRRHHLAAAFRLPNEVWSLANLVTDILFFRSRGQDGILAEVDKEDQSIVEGRYYEENPTHVLGKIVYPEAGKKGWHGTAEGYRVEGDFPGLPAALVERPICAACRHQAPPAPVEPPPEPHPQQMSAAEVLVEHDEHLGAAVALGKRVESYLAAISSGSEEPLGWDELRADLLDWTYRYRAPGKDKAILDLAATERGPLGKGQPGGAGWLLKAFIGKTEDLIPAFVERPRWAPVFSGNPDDPLQVGEYLFATNKRLTIGEVPGKDPAPLFAAGWAEDSTAPAWLESLDVRGELVPPDEYLAGDQLWQRFDRAEARAKLGEGLAQDDPRLPVAHQAQAQARRLIEVIGPQTWDEIEVTPQDGFVPIDILADWLATQNYDERVPLVREDGLIQVAGGEYEQIAATRGLSHEALLCIGWINHDYFLFQPPTGEDENIDDIRLKMAGEWRTRFRSWADARPDVQRAIEHAYQRARQGWRPHTYGSAPLRLARWNPAIVLDPHQIEGARRINANHGGGLGFDVGVGKTFTILASLALARQQGRARRAAIVVPQPIALQWEANVLKALPGYRVVLIGVNQKVRQKTTLKGLAGEEQSETDSSEERSRKWARFMAGEFDLAIVTYEALPRTQMDEEAVLKFVEGVTAIEREVAIRIRNAKVKEEQAEASFNNRKRKLDEKIEKLEEKEREARETGQRWLFKAKEQEALKKARADLDELVAKRKNAKPLTERQEAILEEGTGAWLAERLALQEGHRFDPDITWQKLGITWLAFDEAHAAKNLHMPGDREGGAVPKWMGNPGEGSKRAWHWYFRATDVQLRGGEIVLATATPLSNSPMEGYNLCKLIDDKCWERIGIYDPEAFIDRFCLLEEEEVVGVTLATEPRLACTGFKNLDELRAVVLRLWTFKTAKEAKLKLPTAHVERVFVEMDAAQEGKYRKYVELIEEELAKPKIPGGGTGGGSKILGYLQNMAGVAQHAELDEGYTWSSASAVTSAHSPKYDALAKRIVAMPGCGHIVFSDYVAGHVWIRQVLIEAGVPASRIAVMNGQVTPTAADRLRIARAFNGTATEAPRYDVLIANVVGEEGMDLQRRACAIHHLDIGWTPKKFDQRNGRGVRQGNTLSNIEIIYYIANRSQDGARLDMVRGKASWIATLISGEGKEISNPMAEAKMSRKELLVLISRDPEQTRKRLEAAEQERELERQKKVAAAAQGTLRGVANRFDRARTEPNPTIAAEHLSAATQKLAGLAKVDPKIWPWMPWASAAPEHGMLVPKEGGPVYETLRVAIPREVDRSILDYAEFGRVDAATIGLRTAGNAQWQSRPIEEIPALRLTPDMRVAQDTGLAWPSDDQEGISRGMEMWVRRFRDGSTAYKTWEDLGWTKAPDAFVEAEWGRWGEAIVTAMVSTGGWAANLPVPIVVKGRLELGLSAAGGEVLPPTLAGWQRFLALAPGANVGTERRFTKLHDAGIWWFDRAIPQNTLAAKREAAPSSGAALSGPMAEAPTSRRAA